MSISVRFVGFDERQQEALMAHYDNRQLVSLNNCVAQKMKYKDGIEVVLSQLTVINIIDDVKLEDDARMVTLSELESKNEFDFLCVKVKVLQVRE